MPRETPESGPKTKQVAVSMTAATLDDLAWLVEHIPGIRSRSAAVAAAGAALRERYEAERAAKERRGA